MTILVPTYNRLGKLERAVSSILSQTYRNVLVVVCDNASSDGTEDLVRKLVGTEPRLRYLRHERNVGMIANFNFAVGQINTPFFGFLTDDDYFLPDFVEKSIAAFRSHPEIQATFMAAPAVTEEGKLIRDQLDAWPKEGIYQPEEAVSVAASGNHPILTAGIYRRELVSEFKFVPEVGTVADVPILLRILAKHVVFVSKSTGVYFIRHEQADGVVNQLDLGQHLDALTLVRNEFWSESSIADRTRQQLLAILDRRINALYRGCILQHLQGGQPLKALARHRELTGRHGKVGAAPTWVLLRLYNLGGAPLLSFVVKLLRRVRRVYG